MSLTSQYVWSMVRTRVGINIPKGNHVDTKLSPCWIEQRMFASLSVPLLLAHSFRIYPPPLHNLPTTFRNYPPLQNLPNTFTQHLQDLSTPSEFTHPFRIYPPFSLFTTRVQIKDENFLTPAFFKSARPPPLLFWPTSQFRAIEFRNDRLNMTI